MKTRAQDLAEHDRRIAAAQQEADQTTSRHRRAQLERQIAAAGVGRTLIHERHDRLDAIADQQQAHQQQLVAKQEAEIRDRLRSGWRAAGGDDASFDKTYPTLLEQYRTDRALGRVAVETMPGPKATI